MFYFEEIENDIKRSQLFNGTLLVSKRGDVLFSKSFGTSYDPHQNLQLNEESVFELASVSKQFTAAAVLLLNDSGKLDLHTQVSSILKDFPYSGITVHNLLNHTSGLPDYMLLFDNYWDKSQIAANNDVLHLLLKYRPELIFKPDTSWEYSNTGYVILALIVEKISNLPYEKFLKQFLFDPLNMQHSCVYNRRMKPEDISNYAYGVVFDSEQQTYVLPDLVKGYEVVYYLDGIQGDGTVNSTATDLLKWNLAILNKNLLSDYGHNTMFKRTRIANGDEYDYGYGWFITESKECGKVAFHGGSWPGYSIYNSIYLDSGFSIISLCNKPQDVEYEKNLILKCEDIIHQKFIK